VRSAVRPGVARACATLVVAAAILTVPVTPAWAHVPFLEPTGVVSSARGPAGDPFPDAITVGSPEVSRAIYGYLGPAETADVYRFVVKSKVKVPVGILVPVGPGAETFRPELTIYGGDKPVGMFDRSGSQRATFYEPFSQMTLYRGPEQDVTFSPGPGYFLIVTPGNGATKTGRYVVSMGIVEAFGLQDAISAPVEIARIKAGDYGGAPAGWSWTVGWMVGTVLAIGAAVSFLVWGLRRRAGLRSEGDSGEPTSS
jgi:hypothetical protein